MILVYIKHYSNLKFKISGQMYSLTFDTTGAACSIVLQKDGKTLNKFAQAMDFGQAEVLMPQIKNILSSAGIAFADLGALFVCVGPGSFTGVRSGIAAAKVFGLVAPNLAVGGVSAFDGYVKTFDETEIADINAVIIETRRDDFYVQFFDRHLQKITEPQAMEYGNLLEFLKDKGCLVSLAGDGVERFLNRPSGLNIHAVKMYDSLPVEALAAAGLKQLADKKVNYPKPLYLRAPDVTMPNR